MADVTINDLTEEQIQSAEQLLIDFLQTSYPSMDLTSGRVLRDLLIRPAAIFHAMDQENMTRLRQSMSLLEVEANPEIADETTVDAIMSNYRITRDTGSKTTGNVVIVIESNVTTAIPTGTVFTSNGLNYVTTAPYVGVTTSDAVIDTSDRLIVARADGAFSFTVPVEAESAGSQYTVKAAARFTVNPTPPGLVDAFAAADFTTGTDTETNTELITRFKEALSPQVLSGRVHINALLKELVPTTLDTSIVGFGDEEMIRDRHNIFQVSHGGKADIYVRTLKYPQTVAVTKTATLVSKSTKTWQVAITRNDAPGFYFVQYVKPEGSTDAAAFEITSEVRGLDLTSPNDEFVPDITNQTEGAYSRYQTAVIQFIDTVTDVTSLTENVSTQDYDVYVTYIPYVATIQDDFNDRSRRNPQADYLVRAAVPATVSVNLTVSYSNLDETPDEAAIQTAVADRVNALMFAFGKLPASVIHDAAHSVLSGPTVEVVSPIDINCSIRRPDGTIIRARSGNEIDIPDLPAYGVTSRTTVFYLDPADVDVTLVSRGAVQV